MFYESAHGISEKTKNTFSAGSNAIVQMNINRNNYEAFFLDYHEGRLNAEQTAELMLFLEKNQELKNEFDEFEDVSLKGSEENISFDDKDILRKGPVSADNFDEYAIAFAEGLLPASLHTQLITFAEADPYYKKQLELYCKTVLDRHERIIFENKELLKKKNEKIVATLAEEISETEMLFIQSVEGTLTLTQQQRLNLLLANASDLKDYRLYLKTKLQVEKEIVYPDKFSLKHEPVRGRVLPFYSILAAAATIALLIGALFMFNSREDGKGNDFTYSNSGTVLKKHFIPVVDTSSQSNFAANQSTVHPRLIVKKDSGTQPVIVKNNIRNNENPQENIVKQMPEGQDSINDEDVVAMNNDQKSGEYIISNFYDPDETPVVKEDEEYFSLREAVTYKVKNKLLKDEMSDKNSYRDDKKKFSWYDALLVVVKGMRSMTGRDIALHKKYNQKNELIAWEVSAGKYTYTKPVAKKS